MASKNLISNSEFNRRFDLAKKMRGIVYDSEVADAAGFSRPTITDWRKGRGMPSKRTTILLGKVFNTEPNWFRIDDAPEPNWSEPIPNTDVNQPQAERSRHLEIQEGCEVPYGAALNNWNLMPTDQLEILLQKSVDEKEWGAVEKIAEELFNRKLKGRLR